MARTTPVNSGYTIITGTATGSNASIVDVWLEWKQLSTDIDKNQSQVRVLLYAQCTGSSSTSWTVADKFGYVSCDGTAQYKSTTYNFANNAVNCFGDYTFTVSHDTDGSKSVTLAGAFTTKSSYISGGSVSAKVTLTTIPRASTFGTITGTTLGGTMRVNINRASTSFTHKVHYYRGNNVWGGNVSGTTYADVPLPIALADLSPDSKKFDLLLLLRTYSGSTQIGSDVQQYVTITVPDNADTKPAVTMELSPVSPAPGVYVQSLSQVQASISADGKYGTDIESYSLTVNGIGTYSSPYLSGYLTKSGEITVTGSATDSRGIVGTTEQTITVIPYYKPKLTGVAAYRVKVTEEETEDGEVQRKIEAADDGEYLKIEATRDYAPVITEDGTQHNYCSIKYRYRQENSTAWSEYTEILAEDGESDAVETEPLLNAAFSKEYGYIVQIVATDTMGQETVSTVQIPCERIFRHKRAGGRGLGLGGYCEEDDLLDIHWRIQGRQNITAPNINYRGLCTDANAAYLPGTYMFTTATTNGPGTEGMLLVFNASATGSSTALVVQVAVSSTGAVIHIRIMQGGTAKTWRKITMT